MTYKNVLCLLLLIFTLNACDRDLIDDVNFDRTAMLNNYAENIIEPRYERLAINSNDLVSLASDFQANTNLITLEELRAQFKNTYLAWQGCSSTEFGPARTSTLKAIFNTYPVDTTQINNNINSGVYSLGTAQNIAAIGLPTIDYLLYGIKGTDAEILIALSTPATLNYLIDVCGQMNTAAQQVNTEWSGAYATTFINANGTDLGSSLGLLVNEMNLDFERFIRDGKVGIPLGKRSLGNPQLDKLEAVHAKYSLELLQESILKLEDLYTGTSSNGVNGIGFDDYLDAVNASHSGQNLNSVITQQFDDINGTINTLNADLEISIQNNQNQVDEVYNKLQQMIVYLKVDLASNLGILISYQDNDGD
ncbi:MAG: putative lipoprotein [Chitinophagales bacterium]|jgi:predicted lipoprotein